MANYFKSTDINVYPAGFRGNNISQSKLTTEENITHLQNYAELEDGLYEDNRYDEDNIYANKYILKLKGYTFSFHKDKLNQMGLIANFSAPNFVYPIFAAVKLREVDTDIGFVLANYKDPENEDILDILEAGEEYPYFEGLYISTDIPEGATYYKRIGSIVIDISGGYNFLSNDYDITDFMGNYDLLEFQPISAPEGPTETEVYQKTTQFPEGAVIIPNKIVYAGNILTVTTISGAGFSNTNLSSITLPRDLKIIGTDSFKNCSALTAITIPDSVESIAEAAFNGCSGLISITVPFIGGSKSASSASASTLFGYIFGTSEYGGSAATRTRQYYSSTGNVYYYIPNSLTNVTVKGIPNIFYGAFYNCKFLENISIGEGVTNIGEKAFYSCTALNILRLPESLNNIGKNSFDSDSSLSKIYYNGNIVSWCKFCQQSAANPMQVSVSSSAGGKKELYIEDTLIQGNLILPEEVKIVGKSAFRYCKDITSLTLSAGTTEIQDYAFYRDDLTSITFNNVLSVIGEYAFSSSDVTSLYLPDTVTKIGRNAFEECSKLSWVTLPDSLIVLPYQVFNLSGINSSVVNFTVTGGKSIKIIESKAFENCSKLKSIELFDCLNTIGEEAFDNCEKLEYIDIPSTVKTIGANAFHNCTAWININNYENCIEGAPWGNTSQNLDSPNNDSTHWTQIPHYTAQSSSTTFNAGDYVNFSASTFIRGFYRCKYDGTIGILPTNTDYWDNVSNEFLEWDPNTKRSFNIGDTVKYNSEGYICLSSFFAAGITYIFTNNYVKYAENYNDSADSRGNLKLKFDEIYNATIQKNWVKIVLDDPGTTSKWVNTEKFFAEHKGPFRINYKTITGGNNYITKQSVAYVYLYAYSTVYREEYIYSDISTIKIHIDEPIEGTTDETIDSTTDFSSLKLLPYIESLELSILY